VDREKPVSGPCEFISTWLIGAVIVKSNSGKAAGLSGVVVEMLKASGEVGRHWLTVACNGIVNVGCIPDCRKSLMVNVYNGKDDVLECGL